MRSVVGHEFYQFTLNDPTTDSSLRQFVTIRAIDVFN
jgi:hypothetical protein